MVFAESHHHQALFLCDKLVHTCRKKKLLFLLSLLGPATTRNYSRLYDNITPLWRPTRALPVRAPVGTVALSAAVSIRTTQLIIRDYIKLSKGAFTCDVSKILAKFTPPPLVSIERPPLDIVSICQTPPPPFQSDISF